MKKIEVTIVIASYGGYEYLTKTLKTTLQLKGSNYEVLVVDNKPSLELKEYLSRFENVQYIESDVYRSKNHAMNIGANMANGEYILFLDDDIILKDPSLIEKLLEEAGNLENFGCLSLSTFNMGNEDLCSYGNFFGKVFTKEIILRDRHIVENKTLSFVGHPTGMAFFIRKDVFNKIGGFDEDYIFGGDDSDIGIKLWIYGYKCYLYSKTIQEHIGMANRSDNKKYAQYFGDKLFAHLGVIYKNYELKNLIYTLPLYMLKMFLKSIKQSLQRKNWGTFKAFFVGLFQFLRNWKRFKAKREKVQKERVIGDVFLDIKP